MYILGIDTSGPTGGVALLKGEQLVGESVLNIRTTHSERLLPALEKLLADAEIKARDLAAVSAVTGPGSFTGLRIGIATAKGLSYALQLPAVGVTGLEAYGWQFRYFPGAVVALVDARRGNVYWQAFRGGSAVVPPAFAALSDVYAWCAGQEGRCLCVGDGALNYAEVLRENIKGAIFPQTVFALLRPVSAAHLGYMRLKAAKTTDAFNLNPTYMRKTEAELKWPERR